MATRNPLNMFAGGPGSRARTGLTVALVSIFPLLGCSVTAANIHRVSVHPLPTSLATQGGQLLPSSCETHSTTVSACRHLLWLLRKLASATHSLEQSPTLSPGGGGRLVASTTLRGVRSTDTRVRGYLTAHGWQVDNTSPRSTLRKTMNDGWTWVLDTESRLRGDIGLDGLSIVANPPGVSPR